MKTLKVRQSLKTKLPTCIKCNDYQKEDVLGFYEREISKLRKKIKRLEERIEDKDRRIKIKDMEIMQLRYDKKRLRG